MNSKTQTFLSKRLLTVKEGAEYLGRSESAIREMIWDGKLPAIRADRRVMLDIRDLDHWIDRNRENCSFSPGNAEEE